MAMLQFGGAMCNAVARFAPRTIWRINSQQLLALSSSAAANPDVVPITDKSKDVLPQQKTSSTKENRKKVAVKNHLVEAAFASILDKNGSQSQPSPPLDEQTSNMSVANEIFAATSVENLLAIAASREISKNNALNIMSMLAYWSNKKRTNFSKFDKDPRFLKLCERLSSRKTGGLEKYRDHHHGDLATILGLTGDDEAAKLISTLSLAEMIRVICTLARKQKRSLTILRSLSFNISRHMEKLNIKQSTDLLYSMAVLNFPDEVLLERASADLLKCIPQNKGTAVVGSVLNSLGFLRYKNTELLDSLCEWMIAEQRALRPQYITSLLLTLATVGYTPANTPALHEAIIKPLKEADLPASEAWLDTVWATVVLGLADPAQISSVLDSVFIQKLTDLKYLTVPRQIKLLNINAAAKLLIPNYKGPFVTQDVVPDIGKSKEKQIFACSVIDTLSNLFPSVSCLRTNINTGMGFTLDAECYVDDKCNPLQIDQVDGKHKTVTRIGIIALDYSDICRGKEEPLGKYSLMMKLLEAEGYKIVIVPYTEYDVKDKLVTRVKYIEQKIKSIINMPHSTQSSI